MVSWPLNELEDLKLRNDGRYSVSRWTLVSRSTPLKWCQRHVSTVVLLGSTTVTSHHTVSDKQNNLLTEQLSYQPNYQSGITNTVINSNGGIFFFGGCSGAMAKNTAFICSFIVLMAEMMNVETVLCFHQLALTLSPASRRNLHVVHLCQEHIS